MNLNFVLNFSCDLIRHHPAKYGGISLAEEEILSFQLDTWPHVIRFLQSHYGLRLTICQLPAKFGGHKSFGGRNILLLVCQVTLWEPDGQKDMWLDVCFYLTISHQLAKFYSHRSCQRGYVTPLICHLTSHHYFVRGSNEFIGRVF